MVAQNWPRYLNWRANYELELLYPVFWMRGRGSEVVVAMVLSSSDESWALMIEGGH